MAILGKPSAGGFMDEIRCDEPSYLIWKWHPFGSELGNNKRENAIRWGSSLRVKEGEVAVFLYNQDNGTAQEFIEGPADRIIDTKNFPVLTSIVGLAYQGGTPFQAEVYFINLAKIIQVPFAVPYFDLYDPRFLDFGVPTSVHGKITFNIADYKEFIKLHRLFNFDLNDFQKQIRDSVSRYVKSVLSNIPIENNIPVVQVERLIEKVNEAVEGNIKTRLEKDFGVNITGVDINSIDLDKESEGYKQLQAVTRDIAMRTTQVQADVNIKNIQDMQRINAENMEETLRIQREEAQYAQHKSTQTANIAAVQLEKQAEVGIAGAEALGKMGSNGAMDMSGGGMNPAGIMTGMAMGGAIGQNMTNIMNGMSNGLSGSQNVTQGQGGMVPPNVPYTMYYVAINGQPSESTDMMGLTRLASEGILTKDSLVWKYGMADWEKAENVQELQSILSTAVPTSTSIPTPPPFNN